MVCSGDSEKFKSKSKPPSKPPKLGGDCIPLKFDGTYEPFPRNLPRALAGKLFLDISEGSLREGIRVHDLLAFLIRANVLDTAIQPRPFRNPSAAPLDVSP